MVLRGVVPILGFSVALFLWGCDSSSTTSSIQPDVSMHSDAGVPVDQGPMVDVTPPIELTSVEYPASPAPVPRLTQAQIRNSLQDLFGPDIVVTGLADPDVPSSGFVAVGAGISTPLLEVWKVLRPWLTGSQTRRFSRRTGFRM